MKPTDIPAPMDGHRERVATFEAHRAQVERLVEEVSYATRGAVRKPRGPRPLTRKLTAAQLHKIERDRSNIELSERVGESGLWAGTPRSRRSWSSRLRELELHPERADAIRNRGRNVKAEGKVRAA